jgi:metal-responsive CopG/Arc/MetJ family transcriptional regulator
MKTTISLPDPLLKEADALARRLGKSRDQLYAEAISDYLARFDAGTVTDRMNEVLDSVEEELDPAVEVAGLETLRRVEW